MRCLTNIYTAGIGWVGSLCLLLLGYLYSTSVWTKYRYTVDVEGSSEYR